MNWSMHKDIDRETNGSGAGETRRAVSRNTKSETRAWSFDVRVDNEGAGDEHYY